MDKVTDPDSDLKFPVFWSEVYVEGKWIPIDAIVLNIIGTTPKDVEKFEPKGKLAEEKKLVMGYVVAYDSGNAKSGKVIYRRSICERRYSSIREEFPWKSKKMENP